MPWLTRFRNVFRADRVSDEIEREIAFHLAERVDELQAQGMSPRAARREARRRFGNATLQAETTRDFDLFVGLETTLKDLRYTLRGFRKAPGSTSIAVL